MRPGLAVVFVSSWLLASECTGALGPTGQPDVQGETLIELPVGNDVTFAVDASDAGSGDLWDGLVADVGTDVGPEVRLLACKPGDGCFLDPCEANQDCLSGWCVDHLGKKVCSMPCQDECPTGWTCQLVAGTAPDVVYICISDDPYCANREPVPEECNGIDDDCDGDPCTDDSCDLAQGCAYKLNKSLCDDGNPCTLNDACNLGVCQGSPIGSCDDSNPCTKDSCDAVQGCLHKPVSGACDDGSACTKNDQCSAGKCTGDMVNCDDAVTCTADSCNPATGSIPAPAAGACDDPNSCTDDACDLELGCASTPNTLPCPGGTCSGGKCVPDCIPACAGKQCGDNGCGGQCGQKEICVAGKCQPEGTIECDDGNSIWWDGCTNDKITGFQVNTFTPGQQIRLDTATFTNGGWVAVWSSYDQDGSQDGVYGQRYDAQGNPAGDEFQINSYTSADQAMPSVAAFPDNSFVAAWYSSAQDGSGHGVYAQRFDASGNKDGNEFRVNTYPPNDQSDASVGPFKDGGFVITWQSYNQEGQGYGVFAQHFGVDSKPSGNEFRINTCITYDQHQPCAAMFPSGDYVLMWSSNAQDDSVSGVLAQRYSWDGVKSYHRAPAAPAVGGPVSKR